MEKLDRAAIDAAKKEQEIEQNNFIKSHKYGSYLKNVPKRIRNKWLEVFLNKKNSKAAALKMKCLDCSAYNKSEVEECTVRACPLWNFRPYQKGE